jgi:hypothetical protein
MSKKKLLAEVIDVVNGKVYRIYPHLLWEHTGGTNGHDTEDECIIIEKSMNEWHISKELR